jgi:hypothetical protein
LSTGKECCSHGDGYNFAESLQTLQKLDTTQRAPTLQLSNANDTRTREIENFQYEIMYKAEFNKSILQKDSIRTTYTKHMHYFGNALQRSCKIGSCHAPTTSKPNSTTHLNC